MTHFEKIDDQLADLLRGAVDVISEEELRKRLRKSADAGKPLRVKLGIDPSSPDIHLGHTVVLRKLRAFQDHGHQAVLIIGDYTAMVGDPSGKNKTRPQLSIEQVERNALTYIAQAAKVLDMDKTEVVRNGEWFHKMEFLDVLKLSARTTVSQMLERDDFTRRYNAEQPISLHEFLYPLMQGWDSVMVKADVELGGTDQLFNLLMGRRLQEQEGMQPQVCLTTPIIPGLDGEQKMSKSLGNAIGVNDEPGDMFGKVMSIPDKLMRDWYMLLTREPVSHIEKLLDPDQSHPRDAKLALAHIIVQEMHNSEAATAAQQGFLAVFSKGALPEDMPVAEVALDGRVIPAFALIKEAHKVSGGDARRLLKQGGVKLIQPETQDEFSVDDEKAEFTAEDLEGRILKIGKRHFYRLKLK
ncbi:MAG: tyrosine--tRNA ligase [Planctomycetes bacterium]|nr:tyrosine--tRNA ligase [Planctomycetota bacterium]